MTLLRSSGKFAWRQLKQTWRMVFVTQNRRRPPTSQEKQGTWQATLFRYKLACIGIWDFGHIPQPYSTICKQHSVDCIPSPRPNSLLIQPSLNQFFFIRIPALFPQKWKQKYPRNVRKKIPGSLPHSGSAPKVNGGTHHYSKFRGDLFSWFCVILLTDTQTNKQTEVKTWKPWKR